MQNGQLNSVYAKYKSGVADFTELYAALKPDKDRNCAIVTRHGYGNESDALTLFDDVLFKLIREDVPDFERALRVRLKRRQIDLLRKEVHYRKRISSFEELVESDDDEGAATPELLRSDYVLEDEVFSKKEADHLQVIDFLRDCNPDATTTAIVEAYRALPRASDNAIAKSIGLHHQVVKRKLTALARLYDVNRFGDYRDYLAV